MFVLVINPFSSVVGFFQILREISGPLAAGYKLAANCVCLLLDAGKKLLRIINVELFYCWKQLGARLNQNQINVLSIKPKQQAKSG